MVRGDAMPPQKCLQEYPTHVVPIVTYPNTSRCNLGLSICVYNKSARRSVVHRVTNYSDDGNPVPQFLNPKTYLGGEKND